MKAIWNGQVIAESEATIVVDNNHYFPRNSVNDDFLIESDTVSTCFWKGSARYFTLAVGGEKNKDAAWYYPDAKTKAKNIEGYVAFWKGVEVSA